MTPPFGTVLVANRGEIACRIIATLRRLGIRSVAVYSDADASARHVQEADVAVRLGPAPAAQSYLNVAAVLAAARAEGAEAIHPGYGFLSEQPSLARACAAAGVVFVGPGEHALTVMGDKITAREQARQCGVPVIDGVARPGLSDAELTAAAVELGFPVLIKPAAGGGGLGMQQVTEAGQMPAALATARRIARAAFTDDTLFLERLVGQPRHIEVQVLADAHGHVIALGERECSLQRRHQKVIEEAPSPLLDEATRDRIQQAACRIAASVDYRGVGTVEFLVSAEEPGSFSFLEMNTRLQVEHPVTELVTGVDLVQAQLEVAAGEPLRLTQAEVQIRGHAVEARVYAEDPDRGFLPTGGTVRRLVEPSGPGVRVDSGVLTGSVVGTDYDPMLAKIITWGDDRPTALARLDRALADTVLLGVGHNVSWLRALIAHPDVQAGRLLTRFIDEDFRPGSAPPSDARPAAALLRHAARLTADRGVWGPTGWRLAGPVATEYWIDGSPVTIRGDAAALAEATAEVVDADRHWAHAGIRWLTDGRAAIILDGRTRPMSVADDGDDWWLSQAGQSIRLTVRDRPEPTLTTRGAAPDQDPNLRAPMPGTVVFTAPHDHPVVAGEIVATIEAMKMEHHLRAAIDGRPRLQVAPGDTVRLDQLLGTIEPTPGEPSPPEPTPSERPAR